MAVFTFDRDIGSGGAAGTAALTLRKTAIYLAYGLIAMAIAIPAAIATADAGMFTECFAASCEQEAFVAVLGK